MADAVCIRVEERAELVDEAPSVGNGVCMCGFAYAEELVEDFDGGAGRRRAVAASAAGGIVGERHRGRAAARSFAESRRGEKSVRGVHAAIEWGWHNSF